MNPYLVAEDGILAFTEETNINSNYAIYGMFFVIIGTTTLLYVIIRRIKRVTFIPQSTASGLEGS